MPEDPMSDTAMYVTLLAVSVALT
ncbi:MAG: hypothetical protein QOI36_6038, partial [Pseudonocardiales bacterium]|nr:hypothetical protein [Pseudonocardiales bacterium]